MKFLLRPARACAIADLAELHAACFPTPWSGAEIADLIAADGAIAIVAFDADTCALGFILARAHGDEGEVLTLATAPAARQGGIGRALLNAALADMRALGARQAFLEVGADNEAALGLYRNAGFVEVGVRRAYYRGGERGADALILKCDFPFKT